VSEGRGVSDESADVWTIRRVLTWATADFKQRGGSSPRLDAELLLGLALGVNRIALIVDAERPLAKEELARYRALHQRRRAGEPVAYLRGEREFWGRVFRVDARVLVPRPDTEVLVEVALARTASSSLGCRVLDLCTGSGCVAITIARERPTNRVWATDLSEGALAVARENALRLGAPQLAFFHGDLFAGLPEDARFELITANPPYIREDELPTLSVDVRAFEPTLALVSGADGLDLMRRLVREAPKHLAPGGVLAVELGCDQGDAVEALFAAAGFVEITRRRDYGGLDRVVSAVFPGHS
jgi:release factor glutamine methyltransferase